MFQFGTQQRSDMKFRWACELAFNGRVGKLKEIHVSAPGGKQGPAVPRAARAGLRGLGPLGRPGADDAVPRRRSSNATITRTSANFSLGMISCWGIHHLDIAQWGNGTDATGPVSVRGQRASFPSEGGCDAILSWKVRFEFAKAAPVTFVSDGTPGFEHGIRFVGDSGWVHVRRGEIHGLRRVAPRSDPKNKYDTMPIKLWRSAAPRGQLRGSHQEPAPARSATSRRPMRSDTLCQLA